MYSNFDWSNTELGPTSRWPTALKTIVNTCLHSRFPMMILWEQALIQVYNEAFQPIVGRRHPDAFGRPLNERGVEMLQVDDTIYRQVLEKAETVVIEDQHFSIQRDDIVEERYFTLCYSPIFTEADNVGGILITATDKTESVIQGRRLETLHALDAIEGKVQESTTGLIEVLAENRPNLPFALLYLKDELDESVHLAAATGVEDAPIVAPKQLSLYGTAVSGNVVRVADLRQRFLEWEQWSAEEVPDEAIVTLLLAPKSQDLLGFLILGLNPCLPFDESYERFVSLLSNRLAAILADARTPQVEHEERRVLQDLFNKIPVMITMYEPDFEFLWFNAAFENLLGWTTAEARQVDFDLMEKFYPDPEYRKQVSKYMRSLEPGWRDFRVTAKDGTIVDSLWANIRLTGNRQVGIGIDIRERKKTERALRESEERLQAAVEAGEVGIWRANLETNDISRDASLRRILGLTPEQRAWPIDDFFSRLHPDDREYVSQAWQQAVNTSSVYDVECRILRPDGEVCWIRDRGRVETNASGKPLYITGAALDITERKQAEEALRESEERFRLAAQATNDAVWDWDLETDAVLWSEAIASIFGHESAVKGTSGDWWAEQVHPDDRARVLKSISNVTAKGTSRWSGEYRFRRGDGSYAYVLDRGFVQQDTQGQPVRMIGALQDQTEQKQAEQALRESESRFRKVVMQAPMPLLVFAEDGQILYVNRAWTTLTGYTARDLPTISAWTQRAYHEEQTKSQALVDRLLKEGQELDRAEFHIYRRDGAQRTILISAASLGNLPDGKGLRAAAATDITDRKRAEQALQELNETLEARVEARTAQVRDLTTMLTLAEQRERDRIAQILHDDLQQLLYALQLQLKMLDADTLEANRQEVHELLDRAIATTLSLTVDLSPPVLRGEGLESAIAWLANQMKELHNLEVTVTSDDVCPVQHKEMRILLFQMVRELLFNIVKHADTYQAYVSLEQDSDNLYISVFDDGRGFDLDDALAPDSVEGQYGLFSIRERLSLLGGDLQIVTAPGAGTRITIVIPRSK